MALSSRTHRHTLHILTHNLDIQETSSSQSPCQRYTSSYNNRDLKNRSLSLSHPYAHTKKTLKRLNPSSLLTKDIHLHTPTALWILALAPLTHTYKHTHHTYKHNSDLQATQSSQSPRHRCRRPRHGARGHQSHSPSPMRSCPTYPLRRPLPLPFLMPLPRRGTPHGCRCRQPTV